MNRLITQMYAVVFFWVVISLPSRVAIAEPQQVPATFVVVRSDAADAMTIEFRANDKWQQVELKARSETNLKCDRLRVATTRSDKAVISLEMPVQLGKKYRLAWNDTAAMWDFSVAP